MKEYEQIKAKQLREGDCFMFSYGIVQYKALSVKMSITGERIGISYLNPFTNRDSVCLLNADTELKRLTKCYSGHG